MGTKVPLNKYEGFFNLFAAVGEIFVHFKCAVDQTKERANDVCTDV